MIHSAILPKETDHHKPKNAECIKKYKKEQIRLAKYGVA
jgi:hypothetical protein